MKLFFYVLLSVSLIGCTQNREPEKNAAQMAASLPSPKVDQVKFPPNADSEAEQTQTIEQQLLKEGELTFETGDISATRNRLQAQIKKVKGYIDSENQESTQYSPKTITLTARIPAAQFETFLQNITSKGDQVISKNIRSTDVTTQYIDNKARLESRKALEKRYLELLQKTNKVSEIIEIENKLSQIRGEIESAQGQFNYLLKQIEYSKLDLVFFVRNDAQDSKPGFIYKFKTAFADSIDVLSGLFFNLIRYWAVIVLFIVLIWALRRFRRRKTHQQ
ncbi:MAG: DUF4349 domain-containing protein [Mucilaginibacter polytrichastri]|nr:DUF4349 domain-containing protein [Mucilaginibacter polytrichastri]